MPCDRNVMSIPKKSSVKQEEDIVSLGDRESLLVRKHGSTYPRRVELVNSCLGHVLAIRHVLGFRETEDCVGNRAPETD